MRNSPCAWRAAAAVVAVNTFCGEMCTASREIYAKFVTRYGITAGSLELTIMRALAVRDFQDINIWPSKKNEAMVNATVT
jgi:hypothetical protein